MRPRKRSFSIKGHRTSISLEPPFWEALRELARRRAMPLAALIAEIDAARTGEAGLSTAVRLYILADLKARADTCDSTGNEQRNVVVIRSRQPTD